MKDYPSSSTSSLPSTLFPSGTINTATIDSPKLMRKDHTSPTLSLSSLLFPSVTIEIAAATAAAATAAAAASATAAATAATAATAAATATAAAATAAAAAAAATAVDSQALQQRKKNLRFSPKVSVKKTISRHSMTYQEKTNCWLQEYEFLMIKERNHMIIRQMNKERNQMIVEQIDVLGQCLPLCLRGLEWGLEFEALQIKSFRFGASEEVFTEQKAQFLGDYIDDEAIAYAYYTISSECQFRAGRIALQDRKDIEDYITV
jgi:hypothetical protein